MPRYDEGLDDAQSAEILGCAEGTVPLACSRGLAALRHPLTFYGPEWLQSSSSSYNLTAGSRRVSYGTDQGVTLVSA